MSESSLRGDLRGLAGKSLIYGIGSVALRGISLLVLPLYTRVLTPSEYGTVALGTTLTALLSIIFPLGLQNAIAPFFFTQSSDEERRRLCGTIWLTMVLAALVLTILLDQFGERMFAGVFPKLPFSPYVRISIWTAFFSVFALFPLNLAQVRERAGTYVLLTGTNILATVLFVVVFVVILHRGAFGYLFGALLANALLSIPFIVLALRDIRVRLDGRKLWVLLAFSSPLILHGIASWALSLSDRAILQRYVSLADLGLYSIGYQVGSIMIMIAMAIANAWNPFLFRRVAEVGDGAKPGLAKLVTYYTMTVGLVAAVLCLFGREIIVGLTSERFHAAYPIVPIVVIAYFWNSLYVIPAAFLYLVKRTAYLPIATVIAGIVNVALNIWLIPIYGIVAAAWATFFAFLVLFLIIALVAARLYPFPYEYRRLAFILGYGVVLILAGDLANSIPLPSLLWKLTVLSSVPVLLAATPFLTQPERAAAKAAASSIRRKLLNTAPSA